MLLPFEPQLPPHCTPTNPFLERFSATFHTCIPTPQAFASNALGCLSILAWLFAQLPQIYKNYTLSSTSGLSIFFLVEWCLGDLSNLLGALFTHQASWQVAIGCYYVFVDVCLVGQWIWYEKLRHGRRIRRLRQKGTTHRGGPDGWSGGGLQEVVIEGATPSEFTDSGFSTPKLGPQGRQPNPSTKPQTIFREPNFEKDTKSENEKPSSSLSATPSSTTIYRVGPSSPLPSPSPRTILLIACLAALTHASPLSKPLQPPSDIVPPDPSAPTALEQAGTILSWCSTLLYLGSRLPQLYKNYSLKSTAGLSPHLFAAAFCGNLFYSSALLTNPCGWQDFGAYGGGGWVGEAGSEREKWVLAALPFFLGAAGVLGLDASVGVQFLVYGEGNQKVVVVEEDGARDRRGKKRWRWRKVSGWMRGWIPSISENKGEREALSRRNDSQRGEGYGAL